MLNNVDMYTNFQKFRDGNIWNPSRISTIAWYDADDPTTIIQVGGAVSQWNDKSGNLQHVTQGTGSRQPLTGTRSLNGRNVLSFDGIDDRIDNSVFAVPSSGDISIFMVSKPESFANNFDSLWSMNAATNDVQFQAQNSTQFNGSIAVVGIGAADAALSGGPFNGPSIYNCNFDFTGIAAYNAYIDGTNRTVDQGYTTKLNVSQDLSIMGNRGKNFFLGGYVAEFVAIESCQTTCRELMEGYLAWKWGISWRLPVGHPYKSYPPYAI